MITAKNNDKKKLTNQKVYKLRKQWTKTENKSKLIPQMAKQNNVSISTIYRIINNESYFDPKYKGAQRLSFKLTGKQVSQIRKRWINTKNKLGLQTVIAKEYNVDPSHIRNIVQNKAHFNPQYKGAQKAVITQKLTNKQVTSIRKCWVKAEYKRGFQEKVAKKYNVNSARICNIVQNKSRFNPKYKGAQRLRRTNLKEVFSKKLVSTIRQRWMNTEYKRGLQTKMAKDYNTFAPYICLIVQNKLFIDPKYKGAQKIR